MLKLRHAVILVVFVGLVLTGCGADQDTYVQRNEAILESLPEFPNAKRISLNSTPYRNESGPVLGYGTRAVYKLPAGTRPGDVADFYESRLTGWRLVESPSLTRQRQRQPRGRSHRSRRRKGSNPAPLAPVGPPPVFGFRRGRASVSVNLDNVLEAPRTFEVHVDHEYYGKLGR
jgi:hypothetical protein